MTTLDDIKKQWLEQLDDQPDIVIKDIWVRQQMFHNFRRENRNFYDSGMYDEMMQVSKTASRSKYESWIWDHLNADIKRQYEDSDFDTLTEFLFDHMTKDGVTADDAREQIKHTYGGTFGTPGDEIMSALIDRHLSTETYTVREVGDEFKIYKGDHTYRAVPNKRASRVTDDGGEVWDIIQEFANNKGKPVFVMFEDEGFRGTQTWTTNLVRPE